MAVPAAVGDYTKRPSEAARRLQEAMCALTYLWYFLVVIVDLQSWKNDMFASEKQVRLLEQQRTQVEQLRREAAVTRSKGIYNNNT